MLQDAVILYGKSNLPLDDDIYWVNSIEPQNAVIIQSKSNVSLDDDIYIIYIIEFTTRWRYIQYINLIFQQDAVIK